MRGALLASATLFLLTATSGCVGNITGLGGGGGDDDATDPGNPDTPRNLCTSGEKDIAGPRLLRRLTAAELTASVRDVFALSAADWSGGSPASSASRRSSPSSCPAARKAARPARARSSRPSAGGSTAGRSPTPRRRASSPSTPR
jgi:hypothetical protein